MQLATFGRLLNGQNDELVGFELSAVKIEDPEIAAAVGKAHHANVVRTGREESRVRGMAFEITEAELAAADQYEERAAYVRLAATLASRKKVWVYVSARTSQARSCLGYILLERV